MTFRRATRVGLSIALASPILSCAHGSPATVATSAWTLVWSDEFNGASGAAVDSRNWTHDMGDGCQSGNCGWGNQERQYYTNAQPNIVLNGLGQVAIVGRQAPAGLSCYYGPCRYTSAKIKTQGKVQAQPGRVEARIKLPAGQGLWPAFWLLGTSFPATPWPQSGELDVMENHGSKPNATSSAIHGPGYFGNTPFVHTHTLPSGSFANGFHDFAVEWDSMRVRFLVDSTVHYTILRTDVERYGAWVFDQPFFVILNLAVGGTFDGDPQSDAVLPATMLVDYVRVFAPSAKAR